MATAGIGADIVDGRRNIHMGINVLSVFDGMACGLVALKRAGIQVDNYFASEIDPYAMKIAKKNHPEIQHVGDVTKWQEWDLPKIDLLIGGFPCQSHSNAGKRLGLDDPRGQLMYPMIETIEFYQPEDLLLENVKGFMSSSKGESFRFLLGELNRVGYAVDWIVINSALVSAQNRERLYISGKRLDKCQGLVYDYELGENSHDKSKRINKRNDAAV